MWNTEWISGLLDKYGASTGAPEANGYPKAREEIFMLSHTAQENSTEHWKLERLLLDRWRRELTEVDIELMRPKIIDSLLGDSASGEPVDGEGAVKRFRGQIIYFTDEAVTVRRPCGMILVLENAEISKVSDGQDQIEL